MNLRLSLLLLAALAGSAAVHAQGAPPPDAPGPSPGAPDPSAEPRTPAPTSLKVGDSAPDLKAAVDWWDDKNFGGFEKNRVYLVHFWASTNAPSQRTFAALKALKREYGDEGLEVVGISEDDSSDNAVQFLMAQGTHFDFCIGLDSKKTAWNAWNQGAGASDLPTSFLVGVDGKITWIGRMSGLKKPLLAALEDVPLDALPVPKK